MIARRPLLLALLTTLAIGLAATAPATDAQESADDPGGTAIVGEVPSVLELSLQRGGPTVLTAEVTASIARTQLLAGVPATPSAGALRVAAGRAETRRIHPGTRLALTAWPHPVTRSRVVVRTRVTAASARTRTVLEITAAPQTP